MVKKKGGVDNGHLYAMKVLKKTNIVQKVKTAEHTKTERQVIIHQKCHKILNDFLLWSFANVFVLRNVSNAGTRSDWQKSVFGWNALRIPNRLEIVFNFRYVHVQS